MQKPINQLPFLAVEYAKHLCKIYGGCMEVFITAYAHYAQAVDKLWSEDEQYRIDANGKDWFSQHGVHQ